MKACNILFTPKNEGIVRIKLNIALRTNNISSFTDFISRYKYSENKVRLVPNETDPEDEAIQSLRDLDNCIQNILRNWDAAHHNTLRYDEVLSTIRDALGIEDASQTATVESDSEIKTKQEEADRNTTNLQKHLVEFYGQEAFDIIKSLHERFADTVTSIAYYDVSSGIVLSQDNDSLNARIKEQKSALFRSMVVYLKRQFPDNKAVQSLSEDMYVEGNFNRDTYYQALNLFYSLVAKQPNFKDSLAQANAALIVEQEKQNKIELYKKLVQTLRQNEDFVEYMSSKFTGMRNVLLSTQLYQGDYFSEYYAAVKDYITRYKPELANAITEIEQGNLSILDAANAYTVLTHFDELLKENYGDQISVSEGTFGFEGDIPNKYSYHVDTSHEIKGWQTSEDIGSEKHIAKFTQTVLQSIRIYNWKSGEFMNRRANSTMVIVAFRNLLNALQNEQMDFGAGSDTGQKLVQELDGCVMKFHDHPVKNLQRILELLFEKQPGMRNSLMNLLISKSVVNDFDLSVIKSIYNTVFNKNLANSFYSQATAAGRTFKQGTDVLLNEIAGFIDRNITCAYLETLVSPATGTVWTQPKKKFFNNKEVYLIQIRINNRLNNYEGDRQKLQDDYSFAINEGTGPRTEYTVTIGGNQVSVSILNIIPGQIIDTYSSNNSKMKVTAPADFFNKLQEVNIGEFRYKILHGLPLSENEVLLRDTLQFLDDTLDLGILSNPSIGLQILGTYKEIYQPIDQMNNFLMPLLKLGIRAAYINNQYLKAGKKGLREYLQETLDPIYRHYQKNSNTSKMFTQRFGNLRYSAATYNDTVIGMWADAKSILFGEASKATTKDKQGNSIPNNSVAKMGGASKVLYLQANWH